MSVPNISWIQFAICNDNPTVQFEALCRRLFTKEYLPEKSTPHTDPNTPGIEIVPVLEATRSDDSPRKRISFQAKYFEQQAIDYKQIKKSADQTVKHWRGKLDRVYLYCNKAIKTTCKSFKDIEKIYSAAGIELIVISDVDLLDLAARNLDVSTFFL